MNVENGAKRTKEKGNKILIIKEFFGTLKKRTKVIASICIVFVTIAVVATAFVMKSNAEKSYAADFKTCVDSMFDSALKAEKLCNLTHDVWYNTIFKESDEETDPYTKIAGSVFYSDFNDSLQQLYSASETKQILSQFESTSSFVEKMNKRLKNPPKQYVDAYEEFEELVDCYFDLIDFTKSPTGSLKSYTQTLSQYDSAFAKQYNKTMREIPE